MTDGVSYRVTEQMVRDYLDAREQATLAKATMELHADLIKEAMDDAELCCAGAYKVHYRHITSEQFDVKRFRSAYPELAAKYTGKRPSRRFEVRV